MKLDDMVRKSGSAFGADAAPRRSDAAEADHRIGNSLQMVAGLLNLQARQTGDAAAALAIRVAVQRIHAVSQFHLSLAHGGGTGIAMFDEILADSVEHTAFALGLDCRIRAEPTPLAAEMALNLVVAVNELVINARKHAYGSTEDGVVRIDCETTAEGGLRIVVADDGPGLPAGFSPMVAAGVGFRVIAGAVARHGGAIESGAPGAGTQITLSFPPPRAAWRGSR